MRLAAFTARSPVVIDLLNVDIFNDSRGRQAVHVGDIILTIDGEPCAGLAPSLLALHATAHDAPADRPECTLVVRRLRRTEEQQALARLLSDAWRSDRQARADSSMRRIDGLRVDAAACEGAANAECGGGGGGAMVGCEGSGQADSVAGRGACVASRDSRGCRLGFVVAPFGGPGLAYPLVARIDDASLSADVRLGDVLLSVNGRRVRTSREAEASLREALGSAGSPAGQLAADPLAESGHAALSVSLCVLRWPRRERASHEAARAVAQLSSSRATWAGAAPAIDAELGAPMGAGAASPRRELSAEGGDRDAPGRRVEGALAEQLLAFAHMACHPRGGSAATAESRGNRDDVAEAAVVGKPRGAGSSSRTAEATPDATAPSGEAVTAAAAESGAIGIASTASADAWDTSRLASVLALRDQLCAGVLQLEAKLSDVGAEDTTYTPRGGRGVRVVRGVQRV